MCNGSGTGFGIPGFSRRNAVKIMNGHCVIREREWQWELLHGNGNWNWWWRIEMKNSRTPLILASDESRYTAPLQQTASELWCLSGGKRGDYQNCSVLYCVLKLCTVISTLRWAVLTVLWIGFCHTGHISLCIDLFVFVCDCVIFCFILHSCCIIVSTVGWTWWD